MSFASSLLRLGKPGLLDGEEASGLAMTKQPNEDVAHREPRLRRIWKKGSTTFQLLVVQLVTAGTAFVVNIFSATVMPPEGRGYLALLVQITYLLTVAAMLGIERPYIADRQADFGDALYELVRLLRPGYLLAVLIISAVATFAVPDSQGLLVAVLLVVVYLVGNVCARLVRTSYIASGSVSPFLTVSISTQIFLLAASAYLLFTANSSPQHWFLAYGLSGLIALVVVAVAVVKRARAGVRRAEERRIRREGLYLLPASFGNTAMLRSDRLLLPALASNAQLGIYVVVATTMELASWPIQNWVDASLNKWRNDGRSAIGGRGLMVKAVAATTVLSVLMGIASLIFIEYFLNDSYADSKTLIVPLGLAAVIYSASRVQQGLMIANGMTKSVSFAELIGMAVSVGGYVLLIPLLGAFGAAAASAVGYGTCLIAGLVLSRRELGAIRTRKL
ncbi:lipopolysaccharide biosynthesis protein [Pseudarthrobacter defluvii]|uniref:lipopolysaccharide biosynthesis protein n=1 Tax=Pseudarthrobacter defluvii TaxID=410837 RepID=UPI0025786AC2|nr:polysaccharide biosynthesis C-terminal domain-containing protein [Pseudarthrobacter defluvii]WJH23708.1 polysaccharide biosynthesis C-terminal domain-containing protein [Pseudarthrobacter defluvii]